MAAALSYFQPCRSHLAQPARCLDSEPPYCELPVSSRRRQFIERCARRPETPAQRARLNVESGWSKVEEVRKKFEAQSAASFSRSFESPPRRRLADSLFASFKLPRRREGMAQPRSAHAHAQPKRKSAVELLAETKAFYVKSETVLDRKQELPLRVSSGLSQAIATGGCHLISSGAISNEPCCTPYGGQGVARRTVSAGEGLQSTLRRLLDHSDSRENVYSPPVYAVPKKLFSETRRLKETHVEQGTRSHCSGTYSGTSSSGTSGSKPAARSDGEQGRDAPPGHALNRPRSFGDARVFFPDSFVIPRQRPAEPHARLSNAYSIPSSHSSPENMELPEPVLGSGEGQGDGGEELGAISPPAQYAHSTHERYIRSNSHSQAGVREEDSANINSHKSLPDLHTQTHTYPDRTNISGVETLGRSPRRRRHSTHQRTASCSSKGTRSNHSSIVSSCEAFSEHPSPGEDNYQYNSSRCGSSFARDSGGSSGHYTQRSAPPHSHTPHRTDSGSSTQHSHVRYNSYYAETKYGAELSEWHVSAPLQFQDGAPSPPAPPAPCAHYPNTLVGIHFQASAPPPQFQDEAPPVLERYGELEGCGYGTAKCHTLGRTGKDSYPRPRDYARYYEPNAELVSKQPQYQEVERRIPRPHIDEGQEYVNTSQLCSPEEVSSPLGTFKRQRCLRYKQRRARPVLRSKSDVCDRYRRTEGCSSASAPDNGDDSPDSPEDTSARLHRFFRTLGMDERVFDTVLSEPAPDSPVFFSDVSTVDSNQLVLGVDYTVHGPTQKQIYRNTEPPSVVERNARIIKWLCNCRKMQVTQ